MSENTKIEWADHTFNPWEGCQKVGPGCDHCYAETRNARFGGGVAINWGPGAPRRRTSDANWRKPLAWNRDSGVFYAQHRRRQRVFCASLSDVFDNAVDRGWRDDLATLILNTPNLDWLLLTKRIGNAGAMLGEMFLDGPPDNLWLGATIVNQEEANRDIQKLLATPAHVRFLSMEPLLGQVVLDRCPKTHHIDGRSHGWRFDGDDPYVVCHWCGERRDNLTGRIVGQRMTPMPDWVIVGGESGPHARPMHPDWVRSLRDQCAAAGVPFLFKQWGEYTPGELAANPMYPDDTKSAWRLDQTGAHWNNPCEASMPRDQWQPIRFMKVGKKAAGRLLDGVQHHGFPTIGGAA